MYDGNLIRNLQSDVERAELAATAATVPRDPIADDDDLEGMYCRYYDAKSHPGPPVGHGHYWRLMGWWAAAGAFWAAVAWLWWVVLR